MPRDFKGSMGGDLSEVANRITLGAGGGLSRSGNWIFYDAFDDAQALARWDASATGGGTVTLANTIIYRGTQAVKFLTAAAISNQCTLQRAIPVSPVNKFGVEFMFRPQTQANWELRFILTHNYLPLQTGSGGGFQTARVYIAKGDDLTVLDETVTVTYGTASSTNNSGRLPRIQAGFWHNIKLTFDPSVVAGPLGGIGQYGTLRLNNYILDLSGFPLQSGTLITPKSTDLQYTQFLIAFRNNEALAKEAWLDDIIITNNEP